MLQNICLYKTLSLTCLACRSNRTYCWHWSKRLFFRVQKWRTRFSLCSSSLRMAKHKKTHKTTSMHNYKHSGTIAYRPTVYFAGIMPLSSPDLWLGTQWLDCGWRPQACSHCFDGCIWERPLRYDELKYTPRTREIKHSVESVHISLNCTVTSSFTMLIASEVLVLRKYFSQGFFITNENIFYMLWPILTDTYVVTYGEILLQMQFLKI